MIPRDGLGNNLLIGFEELSEVGSRPQLGSRDSPKRSFNRQRHLFTLARNQFRFHLSKLPKPFHNVGRR